MIKVTIDDKTHEVEPSALSLPDGYGLITPDNIPDGYFTKEALEKKIQTRLSKAEDNAKDKLKDDTSFHKEVLSKYNIQLDSDGKPKGLKPTVDVDEAKKNAAEEVRKDYEEKLEGMKSQLDSFKNRGKKSAIIDGANKIGIDGKYLEPLVEGGSPYLVKELDDKFSYNEEIGDYALLDDDGTFAVDGNGYVTTDKFFEKNTEKFKSMLKDNRQRGSNFQGPGKATNGTPSGNPTKWKRDKKLEYIDQHGKEGYKELLDNYRQQQKATAED